MSSRPSHQPAAHPLDNPIWSALSTTQSHLAEIAGLARKFPAEIGPLAGLAEPTREAYASLAKLLRAGTAAGLFLQAPAHHADVQSAGLSILEQDTLVQMIYSDCVLPARKIDFVKLTPADAPEMMALASLTKPGPFGPRTHELGSFIGVRREGRLAAMSGERLHLPGYTEISAVCAHPDHLGHGYATALMVELIGQIRRRNELPILHVRSSNARALELYHRLGFSDRCEFSFAVIAKSAA